MQRIIAVASVASVFASASLAQAPRSSPARHLSALRFAVLRRDVGPVHTGGIADTHFPVRNAGGRTVHLSIEGECGCMTARGPHSLPAGGAGEIYVRFQPQALWSGKVEKVVTVATDEPGHPETHLTLVADIIPYIRIGPQNPVVIRYAPGGTYARELTLTPRAGRAVTIRAPRNISAGLVRARLAPPSAADRSGTYGLHLDVGPVRGPGDAEETLMLPTSDPRVPMLPVVVDIVAARGPVVSPRELFAPAIDAGDRGIELTKLQVFTRSGQLHLKGVDTGNRGMEARVAETTPGRAYQIALIYTGGWRPGGIDTLLKIRTDDLKAPVLTVPFHILVR